MIQIRYLQISASILYYIKHAYLLYLAKGGFSSK